MKLTNFTVITMLNILDKFVKKKLPQKISYAITRNILLLQEDYHCYIKSLDKLFSDYDKYIVKDEKNHIMYNDIGIPIVENKVEKEFHQEIENLLNIEIEKDLYSISEESFDYEDTTNRYDSLSAVDIMNLQAILCNQNETEKRESKKEVMETKDSIE